MKCTEVIGNVSTDSSTDLSYLNYISRIDGLLDISTTDVVSSVFPTYCMLGTSPYQTTRI